MKKQIAAVGATPTLSKQGNHNQIETKEYQMNKTSKRMGGVMTMIVAGLGMLGVLMTGQDARGATTNIISSSFSMGYGYNGGGGPNSLPISWNDLETAGANTSITNGVFTFVPTVTGTTDTSGGPQFPVRVLTSFAGAGYVGQNPTFLAGITGAYIGGTPLDAAPIPNYQLTLAITSIRIYGYDWGSTAADFSFSETTSGHAATSPAIATLAGSIANAAAFAHLVWDPVDYSVAGTSSTRTFTTAGAEAIDGFEVFGTVSLTYDTVPEPGTLGLLGLGIVGGLAFLRRRAAAR